MGWTRIVWIGMCATLLACGSDPDDSRPGGTGGAAGWDAGNSGFCPDPEHPRVHYESQDPNQCASVALSCTSDQNGFDNPCGCGCIDKGDPLCPTFDDPAITWFGIDPSECTPEPPACGSDETPFSNSCGCGCVAH